VDARAGVAERGQLAQRAALGRVPVGLAERLAAPQRPGVAHALEDRLGLRVVERRALEAQVDPSDLGALARLEREAHGPGLAAAVDGEIDPRREVALGGGNLARFAHRFFGEARELLRRHLRIVLPAREVQSLAQHLGQRLRRLDLDPVSQARLCKGDARAEEEDRREEAHGSFDSARGSEL
jgi:hypothetical protein